jgi:hypothetical protein
MESNDSLSSSQRMKIRAYGISASSVRTSVEELTGAKPTRKQAVLTSETGRIYTESEIYSGGRTGYCDCSCSGSGDGEGLIVVLVIIAVLMIMVAVVWTIIMIAFSILTVGGFLKRRYRTVVVVEKRNREFLGKLAISIFRKGGVLEYPFNFEGYDAWVKRSFKLHVRLKHIRQFSLVVGLGWGWIEVIYKLYQVLLDNTFNYNLWPFRIVMVAIFLPLLLYSPVLEIQFDNARRDGEEMVVRLLHEESSFSPDHPMTFEEEPRVVAGISTAAIKKIDY